MNIIQMNLKNKRGNVSLTYYIIRVFIVMIIMLVLMVEIGFFTNIKINTNKLEQKLIAERILNGPRGIAHEDSLGHKEPGTIDIFQLKQGHSLDRAFAEGKTLKKDEKLYGARVSVYYNYYDALNFQNKIGNTFYYLNEDLTKNYLVMGQAGITGPGSSEYYLRLEPKKIYLGPKDDKPKLGFVVVEVIKKT